jgi:hypothetical protein
VYHISGSKLAGCRHTVHLPLAWHSNLNIPAMNREKSHKHICKTLDLPVPEINKSRIKVFVTNLSVRRVWLKDKNLSVASQLPVDQLYIRHNVNLSLFTQWNRGSSSVILNLVTRWRCMVSFTTWPLYPWIKYPSIRIE